MADPIPAAPIQAAPTQAAPAINLVDIKEPLLADSFYLTPLHVALALIVLAVLIVIARKLYLRWQLQAPKRAAIRELKALTEPSAADINLILKRFLRSVASQHPALTQSGESWQQFLAQTVTDNPHKAPDITALLYQPKADSAVVQAFYQYANFWLIQVKVGDLHA